MTFQRKTLTLLHTLYGIEYLTDSQCEMCYSECGKQIMEHSYTNEMIHALGGLYHTNKTSTQRAWGMIRCYITGRIDRAERV